MNAVDTNIFVYAADADEPEKQSKATELLDKLTESSPRTVLLWQVAGELLSCLRRWQILGRVSADDVEAHIRDVATAFPLVVPTEAVLSSSLDLFTRYSLSHWDSMLLAACIDAGVDTLYSEDLGADESYDSVTVVNPLA